MKLNKDKLYLLLDALEDQRCPWEKGLRGCKIDCTYRLGEDCIIGALEEAIKYDNFDEIEVSTDIKRKRKVDNDEQ